MIPGSYNIPDQLSGDTWDGMTITYKIDDVAVDITGSTIVMSIRRRGITGPLVDQLTTTAGDISISDGSGGIFIVNDYIVTYPAGLYHYDVQITLSGGAIYTILAGVWEVKQDVTYS